MALAMTCPIEIQQVAEIFNNVGLKPTHTKAPPQIVVTSKSPAIYEKIVNEIYRILPDADGYDNNTPVMIKQIKEERSGTPGR